MASFGQRILGAAKLDRHVYEEVEADTGAMGQAMGVVVLSSVAAGIGAAQTDGVSAVILAAIAALIGWFVWAYLTYLIGAKVMPEPETKADVGQLLRTIGFSSSPGLIRVLGLIPGLFVVISIVAGVWMLIAMVVAVKQALDYTSTFRAVGVVVIGWIIQAVIIGIAVALFGGAQAA